MELVRQGRTQLLLHDAVSSLARDRLRHRMDRAHLRKIHLLGSSGTVCRKTILTQDPPNRSIGQQGAGLVDAVRAVLHSTAVNPSYINLNDTDNFQATHRIEITNSGAEEVVYQLSHRTEPTYFSRNADAGIIDFAPAHSTDLGDIAVVQLSATELTIGPGQTASVEVTFVEPAASDASRLPIYGGGIDISGSNDERLSVSYMGKRFSLVAD